LDYEENRAEASKKNNDDSRDLSRGLRMNKGMVRLLTEIAEVGGIKMTITASPLGSLLNG
jgi:hypothetical protein